MLGRWADRLDEMADGFGVPWRPLLVTVPVEVAGLTSLFLTLD